MAAAAVAIRDGQIPGANIHIVEELGLTGGSMDLWRRRGDWVRATVDAARAGQLVGYALIALGLFQLFAGAGIGGLWLAFIGWFMLTAARAEQATVTTRQLLDGVRVGEVMSPQPHTGSAWFTVEEFIQRYVLGDRHSAYPVEGFDGQVQGLVTLAELRAVPPECRSETRVRAVAIPLTQVPTAAPGELLIDLLERLSPQSGGRTLVLDAGRLVGIVTPTDITRQIERSTLRPAGPPRHPGADFPPEPPDPHR